MIRSLNSTQTPLIQYLHDKLTYCYRFYSTHDTEKLTSLDEYISRMKPEQDTILYLPGDTKDAILKSPILKKYQRLG